MKKFLATLVLLSGCAVDPIARDAIYFNATDNSGIINSPEEISFTAKASIATTSVSGIEQRVIISELVDAMPDQSSRVRQTLNMLRLSDYKCDIYLKRVQYQDAAFGVAQENVGIISGAVGSALGETSSIVGLATQLFTNIDGIASATTIPSFAKKFRISETLSDVRELRSKSEKLILAAINEAGGDIDKYAPIDIVNDLIAHHRFCDVGDAALFGSSEFSRRFTRLRAYYYLKENTRNSIVNPAG